jgi:hypothetical protein
MSVRRPTMVAAALAASAAAVVVGPSAPAATRSAEQAPPRQLVQFGYVRSLVQKGSRYELRFDPALWLSGKTANQAAIEDGVIPPGDTVPNDYYIRNESRRQLTYRVPRTARVTILTNEGRGPRPTRITVAELSQIARGRNPRARALYDSGNFLGYWLRSVIDTVVSLQQQYQP